LEAARTLHPDVTVLDISMPIVTGLEIVACLRDAGSRAALVFLTVHDEEDTVSAARAAGGIGYVVKSRLGSDLRFAVEEAIAGRQFVSPIP
jgi:DNA-binding NarL/FixJ family response regulator